MGIFEKFKQTFTMPEENYLDDVDIAEEEEEEEYIPPKPQKSRRASRYEPQRETADNVVDIRSSSAAKSASKTHVVFLRLNSMDDAQSVADVLKEGKIVILNLESCADNDARRSIDYLSGVAYAKDGDIRRVALKAYLIIPENVPLTGELLDEVKDSAGNLL